MEELDAYRHGLVSALEGVVSELSKIVAGVPSNAWQHSMGREAHTPHYLLAHLLELETQIFGFQLQRILEEDTPLLPPFDDKTWMTGPYDPGKPAEVMLEEFSHLRKQQVHWLWDLPPEVWSRTARHPCWGVHTLQWWVELQLDYSIQHLKQLAAYPGM